jgi:ArsR family transcriptional regulator, arsenate/arsenite/antimonite-responsive transcriptional repressor
VKIVNLLSRSDEPVCVCELVPVVELSQPTVSHHLKKLTEAGLLEREERGKWAYYSLSGEAVERLASLVEFKEAVR